jgi:regulator of sigma E protease
MAGLQAIIYFGIFLGVLVTVHEAGHFFAAKLFNVKVLKFSIGFGPKVLGFRRGETEYQVALLPLGGFVSMLGMVPGDDMSTGSTDEEVSPEDAKRSLLAAAWWKRVIIAIAGPAFNLAFPVIALFFVFLGDHQTNAAWVGAVEPQSAAAVAGVQPNDIIVSLNGTPIDSFGEISGILSPLEGKTVPLVVKRDGKEVSLSVTPKHREDVEMNVVKRGGLLGVSNIARPAIIGVAPDSAAAKAGLQSFDRILSINGTTTRDEIDLLKVLESASGLLAIKLVRSENIEVGGASMVNAKVLDVSMEKQSGTGLAALGAESGDLMVADVFAGSHAQNLGFKRGDRLLAVNGKPMLTWGGFAGAISLAQVKSINIRFRSGLEEKEVSFGPLTQESLGNQKYCLKPFDFGVRPRAAFQGVNEALAEVPQATKLQIHNSWSDALKLSVRTVPMAIGMVAGAIGGLFTLDVPIESLGGPMAVFAAAKQSAEDGPKAFLDRMALISVNLGLFNLLPIPIFDGFTILTAVWEGIRRRPLSPKVREVSMMIGLAMVGMLFLLAIRNDIARVIFC